MNTVALIVLSYELDELRSKVSTMAHLNGSYRPGIHTITWRIGHFFNKSFLLTQSIERPTEQFSTD